VKLQAVSGQFQIAAEPSRGGIFHVEPFIGGATKYVGRIFFASKGLSTDTSRSRYVMARPPLSVFALAHQAGLGQHLDVFRHRLDGDVVGIGGRRAE
jgi:hypothetical protein